MFYIHDRNISEDVFNLQMTREQLERIVEALETMPVATEKDSDNIRYLLGSLQKTLTDEYSGRDMLHGICL